MLAVLSAWPVLAGVTEIDPSDNLQAAVDALQPGDELVLQGGTYTLSSPSRRATSTTPMDRPSVRVMGSRSKREVSTISFGTTSSTTPTIRAYWPTRPPAMEVPTASPDRLSSPTTLCTHRTEMRFAFRVTPLSSQSSPMRVKGVPPVSVVVLIRVGVLRPTWWQQATRDNCLPYSSTVSNRAIPPPGATPYPSKETS